jgi:hypothetical protein
LHQTNQLFAGQTYSALDLQTQRMVAIKIENATAKKQVLKLEAVILKKIQGALSIRRPQCQRRAQIARIFVDFMDVERWPFRQRHFHRPSNRLFRLRKPSMQIRSNATTS